MAIKIIQNDFNQQGTSNKKNDKAREETGGGIDYHQIKRPTSLQIKTGDIKLENRFETLTDENSSYASLSSDTESDEN